MPIQYLEWNAVKRWFASVLQWFNDLSIGWKIGIGIALFALACIITVATILYTGGTGFAALVAVGKLALQVLIGVASTVALSAVMALAKGESVPDAMLSGLADGVFWGGVFAFVTAGVNAVKAGVRAVKNAKLAGSAQPCNTVNQCFKEGTLVETEEGLKPIEEIEIGDKVLAYDEEMGEQAYKPVVQLFRNQTKEWYHVFANGEEIICTGGHPFYVQGKGFVKAKDLSLKDKLTLSDGAQVSIDNIEVEKLETPETKYNFEVEDFHTYYVTDSKVLVHNVCKLNPEEIRYTQNSISSKFKDGSSIDDMIKGLKDGSISADNVPAIKVFNRNGKIYSLDNRRLYAFKQAGMKSINAQWASKTEVLGQLWKFTTITDGLSIIVR